MPMLPDPGDVLPPEGPERRDAALVQQLSNDLRTAIIAFDEERMRVLLQAGADPNHGPVGYFPVAFAVTSGTVGTLKILLDAGGSLDVPIDDTGWLLLDGAMFNNTVEMVGFLLDQGVDPLKRDPEGRRAIDSVASLNLDLDHHRAIAARVTRATIEAERALLTAGMTPASATGTAPRRPPRPRL